MLHDRNGQSMDELDHGLIAALRRERASCPSWRTTWATRTTVRARMAGWSGREIAGFTVLTRAESRRAGEGLMMSRPTRGGRSVMHAPLGLPR
jgi:hypothetical protein